MTIHDVLAHLRETALTEREKGTQFERLMRAWLRTDARYAELFAHVWMWIDFPAHAEFGGNDVGIDLVAETHLGDYWAIQCKFHTAESTIDKAAVDSFLATSSRTFTTTEGAEPIPFAHRLLITTTNRWSVNAEEALQNQNPPVTRLGLHDLDRSAVDWEKLLHGMDGPEAICPKKQLRDHQRMAISKAMDHYATADRGKLIMACGTGKTLTSLRLVEQALEGQGLVLFLVPSIALLGQSLNDWMQDALVPIKAICICSDGKASRGTKRRAIVDETDDSVVDLALPASTSVQAIVRQLVAYQGHQGLTVVFSTYQSIDVIAEAQAQMLQQTDGAYGTFDFIVCDEAHRTTGVKLTSRDESHFIKVHDNAFIRGRKRLYMTATPRLYGESAKIRASKSNCVLCSMDDRSIYGDEFYRVNFSYAVQNGILTDYKVLVLTVSETMIPPSLMEQIRDAGVSELNYDDTGRLIGVINGLSKNILGDHGITWDADPRLMRRALAFTHRIGRVDEPGSSKNIAHILPRISRSYNESLPAEEQARVVRIASRHVDGTMGAIERNDALAWLAQEAEDPQECRIITNVRCLSEGVDVPALDAVLFLSARNSQVDVVQSVGRVMRAFHQGQADEKRYGYIIIPVIVPEGMSPEQALKDNTSFSVVWDILNALRSHDDHFNAHVNAIDLNRDKGTKVTVGIPGFGHTGIGSLSDEGDANDAHDAHQLSHHDVARRLALQFGAVQQGIYAKLVEKCGERLYWENWAAEVGQIARKYIARITRLVEAEGGKYRAEFDTFTRTLQQNLNPGITPEQCIEMLAQHIITRPVFEALFADYQFVSNNSISSSMQQMIDLLESEAVDKDLTPLSAFYDSVRTNIGKIDNLAGKQTVIKNLYEKFFKGAFPLTVEKLGTVYTPVECVDFILHSVDDVLQREFGSALTNQGAHILDPFTGTGTFITRLLQSGLIRPQDMVRKYTQEIHANELVLLAYYIADVNIESVFQEVCPQTEYLPFDGLCLTDTFQLGEQSDGDIFRDYFRENSEAVEEQRRTPIRVIIGNPPYSMGQKAANDNAPNQSYPHLEECIANTYAARSSAGSTKALYDSYIKAFRWATDRLSPDEGGVIAFISNGGWVDGNGHDGLRASLQGEFDKIYIFHLRGNQRTSGELSRREGGKIFGSGSRAPIAITILVRLPQAQRTGQCQIRYHDIGDYLSREQKLSIIRQAGSYTHLEWTRIEPNERHDWLNQRDGLFETLVPLAPKEKFDAQAQSLFTLYTKGITTARDGWAYSYDAQQVQLTGEKSIATYNETLKRIAAGKMTEPDYNTQDISWSRSLCDRLQSRQCLDHTQAEVRTAMYRPFCKQHLYWYPPLVERRYRVPHLYCNREAKNFSICLAGLGGRRDFSCLITEYLPDLEFITHAQCFPLHWYEERNEATAHSLFGHDERDSWVPRDGISDWALQQVRSRFAGARSLTKEDIFYYVYGVLHSPHWRARFADDLRKTLPHIPIVEQVDQFMAFSQAGRALADLHLHYEHHPAPQGVVVAIDAAPQLADDEYALYAVQRMRFPAKGCRDTIIYNGLIRVENIPAEAYGYQLNGKSAIELIMDRYAITVDKRSGITNDPNLWCREQGKPRYILNLLLSIIHLSLETQRIVATLPELEFPQPEP